MEGSKTTSEGEEFYDSGYVDDERSACNRITFDKDKFYGREQELAILHRHFDRVFRENTNASQSKSCSTSSKSSIVILHGSSGSGKSFLVHRFVDELGRKLNKGDGTCEPFLFLSGKYEDLQAADPFYAIIQVFTGLCRFLLQEGEHQKETLQRIRISIQEKLGSDAHALSSIIPDFEKVIGPTDAVTITPSNNFSDNGWNRILYLFQKLMSALCDVGHPIIVFLDDLQWADAASTKLLRALLRDSSLNNFMFIGAMREEEKENVKEMEAFLGGIETGNGKLVEKIDLLNLNLGELGVFIADSLELDVEECQPLTAFVYDRTRGNIFFAMQMLEELERKKFLTFSVITFRWEWNLTEIDNAGVLSDNIDDAVAGKLHRAPKRLRRALILASYTRSTFDVQTLHSLMTEDGSVACSSKELVQLLDYAVQEGFLTNTVGSTTYRFAHDRIQQAAYSLVKAGATRNKLRVSIGEQLFMLVQDRTDEDWMLYVAADHLNSCSIDGVDFLLLTRLNYLCGKKAFSVAAYAPASIYLRLALKALRKVNQHWQHHYYLSLGVYRALCDVEFSLGNSKYGDEVAMEIKEHTMTFEDRLPTIFSQAVAKGKQERYVDAYAIIQGALVDLRAIPRRHHAFHMIKDMNFVNKTLKMKNDTDILGLKRLRDERKKTIVKFLAEGQLRAFQEGNTVEFMFCCLRVLRITLKYGLSAEGASSFAAWGVFLENSRNDHSGALRMAKLAKHILERVDVTERDNKRIAAMTLLCLGFYIEPWSCSREEILTSFHIAHKTGMESGNIEVGLLIWVVETNFAFSAGYPLGPVEKTCGEISQQLQIYNSASIQPAFENVQLPITYLRGKKSLDWNEIEAYDASSKVKSGIYPELIGYLARLELAMFYGKIDIAIHMSTALQPYIGSVTAYVVIAKNLFYSGLAHSRAARLGNVASSGHLKRAMSISKNLCQFFEMKKIESAHKSLILKADLLACQSKDMERIAMEYEEAIRVAIKSGYLQDAALASEIAGEFLLSKLKHARATQFFSQAHELYREWGAVAKCDDLIRRRSDFVDVKAYQDVQVSNRLKKRLMSIDLTESKRAVNVTLLEGQAPRTSLPEMSFYLGNMLKSQDKEESTTGTEPGHDDPAAEMENWHI